MDSQKPHLTTHIGEVRCGFASEALKVDRVTSANPSGYGNYIEPAGMATPCSL